MVNRIECLCYARLSNGTAPAGKPVRRRYMLWTPSTPQIPLMVLGLNKSTHIELRAAPRDELYPASSGDTRADRS